MGKGNALKTKAITGISNLNSHWKTPPDGYFVSCREFMNLSLGFGGLSFLSVIIQWTTLAMNIPMMLSYFKVSTGFIFIAGIAASVLCMIPMLFYDLTEKKHANYIRAIIQNYQNHTLAEDEYRKPAGDRQLRRYAQGCFCA